MIWGCCPLELEVFHDRPNKIDKTSLKEKRSLNKEAHKL
jgi:hypothetical protein